MTTTQPLNPLCYLARVVIEFETAFIIGSGKDLFFDDTFVADANGLPSIPGSTLAGILRHGWVDAKYGDGDDLFGHMEQGSPLEVSWGCLHNKDNTPVEGVVLNRQTIIDDKVLCEALTMASRDHVRISDKGTAEKGGKFDERSVSAGHRFTFELQLTGNRESQEIDQERWEKLLGLLVGGTLRIGGKTRRGYGAFVVRSLKQRCFDLSIPYDFDVYVMHPVRLALPSFMPESINPACSGEKAVAPHSSITTLNLQPEGFWMFGGGFGDIVDMNPQRANRIVWDNNCKGSVQERVALVPGSSVKGALAHRTAYYHNLLLGRFAKKEIELDESKRPQTGDNNEAVRALFGYSKDKTSGRTGQRGRVIISDIYVNQPGTPKVVNHVSIDRFTAGALAGALFSEEPFFKGAGFKLDIVMSECDRIDALSKQAFEMALDDLTAGLLPLGGGVNRGNGFFKDQSNCNNSGEEQKEAING